ncbi:MULTISPECIES: dihydroorotase [Tenacibaculum]|uniref:dihydroorotase n=1 Tax=Tenacibaculum TaxID=104267 RepID=UPI001F0A5681|nr:MULTISPECIES: dihydroorotase [Tenacibaculum]MCH3882287.1 dihydroorotase [Tenacibaculum aquimarinum]MCH3885298.1 dihydroorotase [Tenacibaculum aquimarinum]MDO6599919.1 dihydroorotase [Tenacibaculum sp. 1_MG-2023]
MRNNILSSVLAFFVSVFMFGQTSTSDFNKGDVFQIGNANYNNYKHINFPKANFIIKKGGIVNYKNIKGQKVVITSVKEKENGKKIATIKLLDSRKFFNSHKYITVEIEEAIRNKELLAIK